MKIRVVGEDALMLYLGERASEETLARVRAACDALEEHLGDVLVDLVPSYASVLILYDPLLADHVDMTARVRAAVDTSGMASATSGAQVVLPVYYDPESGADLESLAKRSGLDVDDVIDLHTGTEYRVYAIGFAPGFAYLGQVDPRIAAPRLTTPRDHVPAGSVAIADRQTAVYPAASPGGWNLIGRCPLPMFDPDARPPMPMAVGDRVRFESIDRARYLALGGTLA